MNTAANTVYEIDVVNIYDFACVADAASRLIRQAYLRELSSKLINAFSSDAIKTPVTAEILKEMSEVDIRTVNRASLVDVDSVDIKGLILNQDGIRKYINQVKNPYCYLNHGMVVKVSFSGKKKLVDCVRNAMVLL